MMGRGTSETCILECAVLMTRYLGKFNRFDDAQRVVKHFEISANACEHDQRQRNTQQDAWAVFRPFSTHAHEQMVCFELMDRCDDIKLADLKTLNAFVNRRQIYDYRWVIGATALWDVYEDVTVSIDGRRYTIAFCNRKHIMHVSYWHKCQTLCVFDHSTSETIRALRFIKPKTGQWMIYDDRDRQFNPFECEDPTVLMELDAAYYANAEGNFPLEDTTRFSRCYLQRLSKLMHCGHFLMQQPNDGLTWVDQMQIGDAKRTSVVRHDGDGAAMLNRVPTTRRVQQMQYTCESCCCQLL